MPLTERQQFKADFLMKCAEAGLTTDETVEVIEEATKTIKSADLTSLITQPASTAWDVVGEGAKRLGNLGLTAAIMGPPAAGLAAGYGASRLTDVTDDDVEDLKKRELAEEMRRLAQQIQAKKKHYRRP